MRRDDFHYYTPEQMEFKDSAATQTAVRSLITYLKAIDWDMFRPPKPEILSKVAVVDLFGNMSDTNCDFVEYICLTNSIVPAEGLTLWRRPSSDDAEKALRPVSNFLYYMACQGYQLVEFPNLSPADLKTVMDLNTSDYPDSSLKRNLEFVRITEAKFRKVSTSSDTENDLPEDLIKHLEQFASLKDQIKEVCRLQMLGPKYKRADDAMGALLNSWSIYSKQ